MGNQTTGQTISRLAVLTVMVHNIAGERLEGDARKLAKREILGILNGQGGVPVAKVQHRSYERCVAGAWN